jgi:hypothetical protein
MGHDTHRDRVRRCSHPLVWAFPFMQRLADALRRATLRTLAPA